MQSWKWGAFKSRHGWSVERVHVPSDDGDAMAQILFRRRGPIALAYVPRGPVIGGSGAITGRLLGGIDAACRKHRAVTVVMEPDRPLPAAWHEPGAGFAPGPNAFQTARTVKVPLLPDEALLAQMRRDTRQNIVRAERRGVRIETHLHPTDATIDVFYQLLRETSERSGFGIHARAYYQDFLRVFGDQAVLMVTRSEGRITGGLIAARFGGEARSMYAGASSTARGRGEAALLRFAAMRWAREHGCRRYDLGGIAPVAPVRRSDADATAGRGPERGSSLDGIDQFKVGFGGEIVAYPATIERCYRPALAWMIRRASGRFRPAQAPTLTSQSTGD